MYNTYGFFLHWNLYVLCVVLCCIVCVRVYQSYLIYNCNKLHMKYYYCKIKSVQQYETKHINGAHLDYRTGLKRKKMNLIALKTIIPCYLFIKYFITIKWSSCCIVCTCIYHDNQNNFWWVFAMIGAAPFKCLRIKYETRIFFNGNQCAKHFWLQRSIRFTAHH